MPPRVREARLVVTLTVEQELASNATARPKKGRATLKRPHVREGCRCFMPVTMVTTFGALTGFSKPQIGSGRALPESRILSVLNRSVDLNGLPAIHQI